MLHQWPRYSVLKNVRQVVWVESSVELIDLAVQSFLQLSSKLAFIWARIPKKDFHGGHTSHRLMSHGQTTAGWPAFQLFNIPGLFPDLSR